MHCGFGGNLISKTNGCRAKWTKISASDILSDCRVLIIVFKVSLGTFGAVPVFDDLVSTFDLNIQDLCTAKFIHYWYSFFPASDQAEDQGPWASLLMTLYLGNG